MNFMRYIIAAFCLGAFVVIAPLAFNIEPFYPATICVVGAIIYGLYEAFYARPKRERKKLERLYIKLQESETEHQYLKTLYVLLCQCDEFIFDQAELNIFKKIIKSQMEMEFYSVYQPREDCDDAALLEVLIEYEAFFIEVWRYSLDDSIIQTSIQKAFLEVLSYEIQSHKKTLINFLQEMDSCSHIDSNDKLDRQYDELVERKETFKDCIKKIRFLMKEFKKYDFDESQFATLKHLDDELIKVYDNYLTKDLSETTLAHTGKSHLSLWN